MKINYKYLSAFAVLFVIETLIAIYAHGFIREHVGDVLVVVLLYCFIRIFIQEPILLLPLYIFIFATCVEIGQYFEITKILGLVDNKIARIILGATFDVNDIVCYFVGCLGLFGLEWLKRK